MTARSDFTNDQWTLDLRGLGFEPSAQQLAQMTLLCQPPYAVCVSGRWGSGKTSIMRYAMTYLGGSMPSIRLPYQEDEAVDKNYGAPDSADDIRAAGFEWMKAGQGFVPLDRLGETGGKLERAFSRVSTLWFSPWRYQGEQNPMVPLLHSLRDQFSHWVRLQASLGKIGRMAIDAGLEILGNLADMSISVAGLGRGQFAGIGRAAQKAIERIETERFEKATDTERFNLLFEHAIKKILGVKVGDEDGQIGDNHRMVIFVDDLDRCEGEVPLRLLEAIKLYLSTRYCVFVFGLDVSAIEHAIAGHWTHNPLGTAHEYLDKMFQSYVHVPVSRHYPRFIHNRLVDWALLPGAQTIDETARASAGASADAQAASGEDAGVDVDADANADGARPELPHATAQIIADILPPNPRKVKNFLNSLRLAWQVANQRDPTLDLERDLAGFAIVERLRARGRRTFLLLTQHPLLHVDAFRNFGDACHAGSLIEPDDANLVAVFLYDFRHLALASPKWSLEALKPEHTLRDTIAQLDRIKSDRALLKHFNNHFTDIGLFCHYVGLEIDR